MRDFIIKEINEIDERQIHRLDDSSYYEKMTSDLYINEEREKIGVVVMSKFYDDIIAPSNSNAIGFLVLYDDSKKRLITILNRQIIVLSKNMISVDTYLGDIDEYIFASLNEDFLKLATRYLELTESLS